MENATLAILKTSDRKFRVVVHGDNAVWGKNRCYLLVHGQPVKGLGWKAAQELAAQTTPEIIATLTTGHTGSYLSNDLRSRLIPYVPGQRVQVEEFKPAPATYDASVTLLEQRRSLLKAVAKIDAELSTLLGPEVAAIIRDGMARPVNGKELARAMS